MFHEGDDVIDKLYGWKGVVLEVYDEGVKARFGDLILLRFFEFIDPVSLDIRQEDIAAMIDLALLTKDREWFEELSRRLEAKVNGR